eukprot:s1511_g12.t1
MGPGSHSQPAPLKAPDPVEKPQLDRGVKRSFDDGSDFDLKFSSRVKDVSIKDLIFIEIFSGTAGLTAEVRRLGCQHSTGVDAHVTKQVKSPVIRIDLATAAGQQLMWRILQQPRVFAVHLGPPCGTSSRARDIKRRLGFSPPPLRSVACPDGLPHLAAKDRARVQTANILYRFTAEVMAYCTLHGILCSIENPARSFMWQTSHLQEPIQHLVNQLLEVLFHHCAFGATRKKRTKLLVNHSCFLHLNRECSNDHQHDGWGYTSKGWATALEVEYPHGLCKEWALCYRHALLQHSAIDVPVDLQSDTNANLHLKARASLGSHVRGERLRPLMREYDYVVIIEGPQAEIFALPKQVDAAIVISPVCRTSPPIRVLPPQAKQTKAPFLMGDSAGKESTEGNVWKVEYGIAWEPQTFVERAAGLSHPGHFLDGVHEVLSNFFAKMAKKSLHTLALERTEAMRKWTSRFLELKSQHLDGLETAPAHAKKILKNKNLRLFAEMVEASGSPDRTLAGNIASGFSLMGQIPSGGIYPLKPLHATLLPEQVREMAGLAREATWSAVKRSKDNELCQEIYDSTVEECRRGWMRGPFTLDQLPDKSVLTRRFGVRQTATLADGSRVEKFRPIDDFSESLVNVTNACDETIQPMGVDQISAALVRRMQIRPGDQLKCKTIDLRKAYKNLPLAETSLDDAYICVFSPQEREPRAFQTLVLPFGARAAVMGFCRTSYAIWRIGVVIFNLHWTIYFDDFFLVAEVHECTHVDMAQRLLFTITGWDTSDEKEGGFGCLSRILGVQIDLSEAHLGVATICNVESRVRELTSTIDGILQKGKITASEMRSLRGRLVFAEAQIFGTLTGIHMKQLASLENMVGEVTIDGKLRDSLMFLRNRVVTGGPRHLHAEVGRVFHLYTDACYENGEGGLGAVLFDDHGSVLSFFSGKLPASSVAILNPLMKKNAIFELEALAVLMAVTTLLDPIALSSNDRVVLFIDNDAVLSRLVSGAGSLGPDRLLFSGVLNWEFAAGSVVWFERVPSHANPADSPSRGDCASLDVRLKIDVDPVAYVQDLMTDVAGVGRAVHSFSCAASSGSTHFSFPTILPLCTSFVIRLASLHHFHFVYAHFLLALNWAMTLALRDDAPSLQQLLQSVLIADRNLTSCFQCLAELQLVEDYLESVDAPAALHTISHCIRTLQRSIYFIQIWKLHQMRLQNLPVASECSPASDRQATTMGLRPQAYIFNRARNWVVHHQKIRRPMWVEGSLIDIDPCPDPCKARGQ